VSPASRDHRTLARRGGRPSCIPTFVLRARRRLEPSGPEPIAFDPYLGWVSTCRGRPDQLSDGATDGRTASAWPAGMPCDPNQPLPSGPVGIRFHTGDARRPRSTERGLSASPTVTSCPARHHGCRPRLRADTHRGRKRRWWRPRQLRPEGGSVLWPRVRPDRATLTGPSDHRG